MGVFDQKKIDTIAFAFLMPKIFGKQWPLPNVVGCARRRSRLPQRFRNISGIWYTTISRVV